MQRSCIRIAIAAVVLGAAAASQSCKPKGTPTEAVVKDADFDNASPRAQQVLRLLGRGTTDPNQQTCARSGCHNITNDDVREYASPTKALDACRASRTGNTQAAALNRLKCMVIDETNFNATDPAWSTAKLGFFRAAAPNNFFENDFKLAYGSDAAEKHKKFVRYMAMPPCDGDNCAIESTRGLTQAAFTDVRKWVVEENLVGLPEGQNGGVLSCRDEIRPELKRHIAAMRNRGWHEAALKTYGKKPFFGCPDLRQTFGPDYEYTHDVDPLRCFQDKDTQGRDEFAEVGTYPNGWRAPDKELNAGQPAIRQKFTIRMLKELKYDSYYWMRSSADGRFVGNGNGYIEDLKTGTTYQVPAKYDPAFSPNNEMFSYMGTTTTNWTDGGGQAIFCNMKFFEKAKTDLDANAAGTKNGKKVVKNGLTVYELKFDGGGLGGQFCTTSSMGTYQHLGSVLGRGVDTVVLRGDFTNDQGVLEEDAIKSYLGGTTMELRTIKAQGNAGDLTVENDAGVKIKFDDPPEGDWIISPSGLVSVGRNAVKDEQGSPNNISYAVRLLYPDCDINQAASCDYNAPNPRKFKESKLCLVGGKASVSFDERFMTAHHYVSINQDVRIRQEIMQEISSELTQPGGNADPNNIPTMNAGGSANIFIYDMMTGRKIRITRMPKGMYAIFPHFRADGWIYFLVVDKRGPQRKTLVAATDIAIHLLARYPTPASGDTDPTTTPDPAHPDIAEGGGENTGDGETTQVFRFADINAGIPDNTAAGIRQPLVIDANDSRTVVSVVAKVKIRHTYIGDLKVSLVSPDGTRVALHNQSGGSADDIDQTYPADRLAAFAGKKLKGTWFLEASDHANDDTGRLELVELTIRHKGQGGPVEPQILTKTFEKTGLSDPIKDNQSTTITVDVPARGKIKSLGAYVALKHTYVGDLEVKVVHPDGTELKTRQQIGGRGEGFLKDWYENLAPFVGKSPQGAWKIVVTDKASADQGSMEEVKIKVTYEAAD